MIMPRGVQQDTACLLIGFREVLQNPTWEHSSIVEELRKRQSGYNKAVAPIMREIGLYAPDSLNVPAQSSNDSYLTIYDFGTQKRARIPRTNRTLICYKTNNDNGHAVCVPAHMLTTLMQNYTILCCGFVRDGIIHDAWQGTKPKQ